MSISYFNLFVEKITYLFHPSLLILGSLSMQRFWATDGHWKCSVFLFYLSSHYHIYIFHFRLPTVAQKRCMLKLPIIPRVLHYRKSQFHVCALVVPFWPSAHYSPLVIHKKSKYLIAHNMHLGKEVVTHGRNALLIYMAIAQSRIYIVLR